MHWNYLDSYVIHLIVIQLQRQSPSGFWSVSKCQFFLAQSVFSSRRLHQCIQCFEFWLTHAITLHPVMFGKSTFTCSCACQTKVAVCVKSKLLELLEFGSVCLESAKIGGQLCCYLQIATIVFCDMQFLERPSLWRVETLHTTFLRSAPQTKPTKK